MKKLLSVFFLVSFLVTVAVPLIVSADVTAPDGCTVTRSIKISAGGTDIDCSSLTQPIPIDGEDSICCILNTMYNIADWMFVILVGVAGVFIIIGAMNLVMAAGDSAKVKTGRDYIMYAAIGLFVAFIARAIPGLVLMIIK